MIEVKNITKKYGKNIAIENIDFSIKPGTIYGLIGYNGAGKTTLLKTISGIYIPEEGAVYIKGEPLYKNLEIKKEIYLLSEEPFFLPQSNLYKMKKFYKGYYKKWDDRIFENLTNLFNLDLHKNIDEFSKGMKRQAGLIIALSTLPKYLFLDEAFDGLDLSKRNLMKNLLRDYVKNKNATVVVTSHNLQELEDISDSIGMIQNKKMIFSGSCDEVRKSCNKYKISLKEDIDFEELDLKIYGFKKEEGKITFIVREKSEEVLKMLYKFNPTKIEVLPTSLEEVFLSEKEEVSYEFKDIF